MGLRVAVFKGLAGAALTLWASGGMWADAETLGDAMARAYATNPTILRERANLRAVDEELARIAARRRPQISGNFTAQNENLQPTDQEDRFERFGKIDTLIAGIELEQGLFEGFRTINGLRQLSARVEAGRYRLLAAEQALLTRVVEAYVSVIVSRDVLEIAQDSVTLLERQKYAAKRRFEVGEITRTDVAQAEVRLARSEANLFRATARLAAAQEAYNQVTGAYPDSLRDDIALPAIPGSADEAVAAALAANPDLVASTRDVNSAEYAVKVAKGALLPSVTGRARTSYNQDNYLQGIDRQESRYTIEFSVPLWQGGAEYSDIRAAREQLKVAQFSKDQTRREIQQQTRTAWAEISATKAALAAAEAEVAASELAFKGVEKEHIAGGRSVIDVLDAEEEMLRARTGMLNARGDLYIALFSLQQAMGRLTVAHLKLPVAAYDPRINTKRRRRQWIGTK